MKLEAFIVPEDQHLAITRRQPEQRAANQFRACVALRLSIWRGLAARQKLDVVSALLVAGGRGTLAPPFGAPQLVMAEVHGDAPQKRREPSGRFPFPPSGEYAGKGGLRQVFRTMAIAGHARANVFFFFSPAHHQTRKRGGVVFLFAPP